MSTNIRFADVQLADFGSTIPQDSAHARDGDPIGTSIFRSPEAALQKRWGTATDIWSFGATVWLPINASWTSKLTVSSSSVSCMATDSTSSNLMSHPNTTSTSSKSL